MPWHSEVCRIFPENAGTGKPYRGINVVALWAAQLNFGYRSNLWGTYRQWQGLGARVRQGERASLVVFYREVRRHETTEVGEAADAGGKNKEEPRRLLVARASPVFNAEQVEGLPEPEPISDRTERWEAADALVAASGAAIVHGSSRACYWPDLDLIQMPGRERLMGSATSSPTASYYSTLFHELVHYSGAAGRLDRDLSSRFGSAVYAMEELIAELGAAFLSARFAMASEPRPDHAAYVAEWLKVLKSDKKAIFAAAARAGEAADYLAGLGAVTPDNEADGEGKVGAHAVPSSLAA